jgi:hypothetical protein
MRVTEKGQVTIPLEVRRLNAVVLAEIAPRFERLETLREALPSMSGIEEIPFVAAFSRRSVTKATAALAVHARRSCPTF